jgi:hypothetical protein
LSTEGSQQVNLLQYINQQAMANPTLASVAAIVVALAFLIRK